MDIGASHNSRNNYLDRGTLSLPGQLHLTGDTSYLLMSADPYLSFALTKGI